MWNKIKMFFLVRSPEQWNEIEKRRKQDNELCQKKSIAQSNSLKSVWWPDISCSDAARKAAMQGAVAALLVSIVTGLAAFFGLMGANRGALLDTMVFGLISLGIYKMYRAAAIAGLLFFVYERIYALSHIGIQGIGIIAIIISVCFINAIRGTFAYHRYKRSS